MSYVKVFLELLKHSDAVTVCDSMSCDDAEIECGDCPLYEHSTYQKLITELENLTCPQS